MDRRADDEMRCVAFVFSNGKLYAMIKAALEDRRIPFETAYVTGVEAWSVPARFAEEAIRLLATDARFEGEAILLPDGSGDWRAR